MHFAAYVGLLFALLASLFLAGLAAYASWQNREGALPFLERGQLLNAGLVVFSSYLLLIALVGRDYSFLYVFENVDNTLSLTYRIAAFWAGRAGSLLFWHLIIAVAGGVFLFTRGYKSLSGQTRTLYWLLFYLVQAFFLLLLTCHSNPFIEAAPAPADGLGLNPLLQNPGMAFHPPLLFLGYGLFTLPACCALAAMLSGEARSWLRICRSWNLLAWAFLTSGIILGCWWSYMELGWGGYWAWDPVENASLIPWFSATAFLHTSLIEVRRGALQRTNVFLMAGTFLLCIFGTYLVRSGVDVQSLHTFGSGAVAMPLTLFMLGGLGVALVTVLLGEKPVYRALSGFTSRQGMLVITAWVFLALGVVVGLGTMWPVISKLWSPTAIGLDPAFYNRVCLPLFTLLMLIFCICPWFGWKDGLRDMRGAAGTAGVFAGALVVFWLAGVRIPLALISAAGAVTGMASIVLLFILVPGTRRSRLSWGPHLVHLGLALIVLGVAFSGPYKQETQATLHPGESMQVGEYLLTHQSLGQERSRAVLSYKAELVVTKNGKELGTVRPERRWYPNSRNSYAEVSVIPGLGDEIYTTLLGYDGKDSSVTISASVNPLVNWLWIGGTLMSVAPLLLLRRNPEPA
ncbi:MAG: heme lyase CcmF/NrfE family subunit [Desulfovibrio sp.]|jgi:cytochrome c-type biogenesis protein CcmF